MKKIIAFFMAVIVFAGAISVNAFAQNDEKNAVTDELSIYSEREEYAFSYTNGPFVKTTIKAKVEDKPFLWVFTVKKNCYSAIFEVYADKNQKNCLARYQTKELESWFEKDVEDILKHDDNIDGEGVYELISRNYYLETEIATLEPACVGTVAMQEFMVNYRMRQVVHAAEDSFTEVVCEVVDSFVSEVQENVVTSIVGTTVSTINEVDQANMELYGDTDPRPWWQKIIDFIVALDTSDDKPEAPDKGRSIIAKAYAKAGKNMLELIDKARVDAFYSATFIKNFSEVIRKDKAELEVNREILADVIITAAAK